jgi:hypothetical protein
LDSFKRFAVGPEVIADVVFNSAGRFVIRDQGVITVVLRVITKASHVPVPVLIHLMLWK